MTKKEEFQGLPTSSENQDRLDRIMVGNELAFGVRFGDRFILCA